MPKRTLAVLAVAAFGALALPFGLPTIAHAVSTSAPISSITLSPLPIAQPGSLAADTPIQICVQPKDVNGSPIGVGVGVFLSFYSGLFTSPTVQTSTATVGTTALSTTPVEFFTAASCDFTSGTSTDAIAVTYTSPNPTVPPHGRDVIIAADSALDSGTTGACPIPAGNLCNNGTYVYSPVTHYVFNPVPPIGTSLTAGVPVSFFVIAEDATNNAVPGAFLNLSLTSSASPSGSATGVNSFDSRPKVKITNSAQRFGASSAGSVDITYTPSSATTGADTITAQDRTSSPTFSAQNTYTYGLIAPFSQAPYTAVAPFRICDTRPAQPPGITPNQCNTGPGSGPITQNQSRAVTVTGGAVPSTATAIVVNLTAIAPSQATYLSVSPAGPGSSHATSNVNPQAHAVVATLAEVAIGTGGAIDVYNNLGTVNVAVDIEGYVDSTSSGLFNSTTPTRICDTRGAGGGISSNQCNGFSSIAHPIGGHGVLTFNVASPGSPIPTSGVKAVVFNLTAITPSVGTVLTACPGPSGSTAPTVSNLNLDAHAVVPNRVIVPVPSGCGGITCTVNILNSVGSVNVAIDVDGWFGSSGTQFTALSSPGRVCDTRFGGGAQGCTIPGKISAGGVLTIDVAGLDGIQPIGSAHSPVAIVANITAVNATTGTFITVYPGNLSTHPVASDLNVASSSPVTNLVVVGIDPVTGNLSLFNDLGNVDLIVDVFGFYS